MYNRKNFMIKFTSQTQSENWLDSRIYRLEIRFMVKSSLYRISDTDCQTTWVPTCWSTRISPSNNDIDWKSRTSFHFKSWNIVTILKINIIFYFVNLRPDLALASSVIVQKIAGFRRCMIICIFNTIFI